MAKTSQAGGAPAAPKKRRGRAAGLTREAIVSGALRVIDEHGLAGITMRRLGAELGVDAMAIYWHFDDKAAVLDAVVEHEAERLQALPGTLPREPLEVLVAIAQHFRSVLLEHPHLAPILASRPLPQQNAPELITLGANLMRAAGFADRDIPVATAAIGKFGLGYVLQEIGVDSRQAEMGHSFRTQQTAIRSRLAATEGDTVVEEAMITHRLDDHAHDREFEVGFRSLLEGLRRGLGHPPPAGDRT